MGSSKDALNALKKRYNISVPTTAAPQVNAPAAAPVSKGTTYEAPAQTKTKQALQGLAKKYTQQETKQATKPAAITLPKTQPQQFQIPMVTPKVEKVDPIKTLTDPLNIMQIPKQEKSALEIIREKNNVTLNPETNMTQEQIDARKAELNKLIAEKTATVTNMGTAISRAKMYGDVSVYEETRNKAQEELDSLRNEYTELERLIPHTRAQADLWAAKDAKKERDEALAKATIIGQTMRSYNPANAEKVAEIGKELAGAQKEYSAAKRISDLNEYAEKYNYGEDIKEDNFSGQFGANYTIGRLTQDQSMAWAEYLDNPTPENKRYAEAITDMINSYRVGNEDALDENGQVVPWISKSLANYLPQFLDQAKYEAIGAGVGGVAGFAAGQPVKGAKAGAVAASGYYSYRTMKGAAFANLLEMGADENTAAAAANDEAVISSLIEMADTGFDLATLGGGKLLSAIGKEGVKSIAGKKIAEWAGESALRKLGIALAKYGVNILGEGLEEGTQEAVSIANEQALANGETPGKLGLAKNAAEIYLNSFGKDADPETQERIRESEKEGMKIAAMMGGAQMAVNTAATSAVNSIYNKMDSKTLRATAELDIDKQRNEAESEGKSLEAYGTTDRTRQVEFRKAELLAERFGASLEVGDTGTAQGQYQNGVISINKNTTDPVMDVFVHELTHHIETTDHYEAFSKFVTDYISNDMQADVDMMKQAIIADYAENGVNLTDEGAQRELVAKFAESKLFKDEAAVNRLYQTDKTLFERIYYWINDTLTKVAGTEQEKMLLNAQKMFETAANSESSTKTGEIENLYAGQNSKIANINNLEKAIDLEKSGSDNETIRQSTGWVRGMDGKWRFEIADNNMSVDTTGMYSRNPDMRRYSELLKMAYIDMDATEEQLQELQILDKKLQGVSTTPKYLDELVSHPTLFEAYPELRDIRVYFMDKLNPSGSTEGAYSPGFKEIVLKRSDILNKKKFKNNIIHEIQHAIQDIEGFASGTNIEDANRALNGRIGELYTEQRSLNKIENEMIDQLLAKYSKMDEEGTLSEAEIDALAEKEYAELRESIKNSELGKAIQENAAEIKRLKGFSGYDYYKNTAGEIEARDSASRRELDSEARRLAAPDIREDAVFADSATGWSAAEPAKPTVDSSSYPVRSRAELKKEINKVFSIPEGLRSKVNQKLESIAQDIIDRGQIREQDRQELLEVLYDSGTAIKEADPTDKMIRQYLQGKKIYVSDSLKTEFGDDWQNIKNKLMGNKIYLTSDPAAMKPDVLAMEANELFGSAFESDDMSQIIRDMVDYADRGKDATISLGEKADEVSSLYGEGAGDEYYQEFNRKFDAALEKFADKAQIEMDYRKKLDDKVAAERAKWQESAQKKAERQRISEQNRKTLKDIQRLRKRTGYNDAKLTAALNELTETDRQIADNAINNIATNAQRLTEKAKAKLQQNQEFYDKQLADDPNYIPDKKTLDLLSQMDKEYLKDKSLEELQDIHRVITALTQHIDDMDKEIGKNRHEKFETIYAQAKSEIQKAKGRTQKTGAAGAIQKFFTDEQLTPMNVIEMISGWNPDSAFYNHVGKQLEEAEFDAQRYQVEAERILEPFRKEHKEWITKADGQGKDAIWYEIEVPELLNYGEDGKPVFGETKKVYLTPAMKVELARGIRNYDNLRHAEGGVTFPNKDLYSKGQRRAAYSQGSTTLHIAPESMKKLFAYETLTDEEKALFKVSDKLFDEWAKGHINETGQLLDGMDRAIGGTYSKVYTNRDLQTTDLTIKQAIGDIGSLQSRVYSKAPMLAMSVFDAQEDTIDTVKKYCGYGPAVRNVQTLLNWSEPDGKNESMKTTIAEKWGPEIRDYLTSPTNGLIAQLSNKANFNDPAGSIADKVFSNYVSAVFGANPGIVIKQATSFPTFAAVLGFDTMPSVKQITKVDAEEIYKYTPILEYRSLGYSDNEVAQLKNNPTALQKNPVTRFLTGGAITWMDRETVKAAWPWAENYVKKHYPDLKVGTDEFKQKQAEIYNDAVTLTQPMYDNMHRANIMKSKGPVTRALTAFKTVPVQQQNTIRRLYGEWQNASLGQKAEKAKNFRTGALALVAAAAAYESVEFLNDMWKNKGKGYKDDEDELKAENILKKIGSDAAKDLGGMFIGFDEIVTAADKLSKNDIYSSGVISSPGIEQVNNFIDNVGKFGQTAGKAIGDTTTLLKNGGNVDQYIKDNSSELFGAVKDLAETMSMYFGGLPTRNLEKYILGTIRWADEGIAEEYATAFDQTQKKDLKKVNGGALDVRTREYLESRVNTSDTSNKEIARLYDAIGVDAVPAEISSSYKINGEDIELDAAQKQKYQNAYRDAIGSSLDDLITSAAYKKLPDEKKAAAIAELYDYASEKGKEALGSEIDGAAKKLSEAAEGGLDIAEYAIALAETKGLSKKDEKVKAIFGSEISDETKGAVYEDFYGDNKALEAWKNMGGNAYDFVDKSIEQIGEKALRKMAAKGMTSEEYLKYTSGSKVKLSDVPDKGFDTFKELKAYIGDPNNNENWHHIVEQSKGNNLPENKINNVNNVVSVAGGYASVHDTITAYYNSKQDFTDGKTVREWLSGKSFDEQFEFGVKQLQKYGSLVPTEKGWYFIPNEKLLQETADKKAEEKAMKEKGIQTIAEKIDDGISNAGIDSDKKWNYIIEQVDSNEYSKEEAIEWFNSNSQRTNSEAYQSWLDEGIGDTWDYIQFRDVVSSDGDYRQTKITNYIRSYTEDDSLRRKMWALAGYADSSYEKNMYSLAAPKVKKSEPKMLKAPDKEEYLEAPPKYLAAPGK